MKFSEYVDSKGKTIEKPIVDPRGDTGPKTEASPPAADYSGKGWKIPQFVKDKPKPYSAPGTDEGLQKYEKGLGNEGDKSLAKTFPEDGKPKVMNTWPKTTSEQFIEATKDFSVSQISAFLADGAQFTGVPTISAYKKGQIHPDPLQATQYVSFLANNNKNCMESLVRELKRSGGLTNLVSEMLNHPETYKELTKHLAENPNISNKLGKSFRDMKLQELTDVPAEDDIEGKEKKKKKKKVVKGQADVEAGAMLKPEHYLVEAISKI